MSVAALKAICDAREIRKIAMVDDVFDTPSVNELDRTRYIEFRKRFTAEEPLRRAIQWVAGAAAIVLPTYDNLEEAQLTPLWKALWHSQIGGRRLSPDVRAALRDLFTDHGHDVVGMLDLVVELLGLFHKDLGRVVTVHGTAFDPDAVSRADIVLVDFFLGQNLTKAEALERSSAAVEAIVKQARSAGRETPSFLLVSSRPEEIDIGAFRTRSALMKSRFRLFPKAALKSENVAELVNLHDLVDASDRAAIIEDLIGDWRSGALKAIEGVHAKMLELDISDLVYLDCFRLTHEGTTIGNYLRWFLTASLHARVTGELDRKTWKKADGMRLFSVLDESGQLDADALVKTFDGPSDVIASAYGDILFDQTRGAGADAFPGPLANVDLMEGDLFVRPTGKDRQGFANAQILAVMTPSCDLLPRQAGGAPAAKTILFLPGRLKKISDAEMDKSVTDVDFVRIKERGVWSVFHIQWDLKSPVTLDWETATSVGVGTGFRRLGRIRDLYIHKIREKFASSFTRIGTEVAPLFPRAKAGAVHITLVENGSRKTELLQAFKAGEGLLWEIGPVTLKRPNANAEEKLLYQASRGLADQIGVALAALQAPVGSARAEAVLRCQATLGEMDNLIAFVRPMKAGRRGKDGVIEFKAAAVPGAAGTSQAEIVIIPHKDS